MHLRHAVSVIVVQRVDFHLAASCRQRGLLPVQLGPPWFSAQRRGIAGILVPEHPLLAPGADDDIGQAVPVDIMHHIAVGGDVVRRQMIGAEGLRHEIGAIEDVRAAHDVLMAVAVEIGNGTAFMGMDE